MSNITLQSFTSVISELLSEYECVVIPEFGGFVMHHQGAYFDDKNNLLYPPSNTVSFNSLLKRNDGLLAYEISSRLKCSYSEALMYIQDYVGQWKDELSKNKTLHIPQLGKFVAGEDVNKLNFTPKRENNEYAPSYGLVPVKTQLLHKEGISGRIKEEYIARQASPFFNQKVKRGLTYTTSIAAILFLLLWTGINYSLVQQKGEHLSVFFHQHFSGEKNEVVQENQKQNEKIELDSRLDVSEDSDVKLKSDSSNQGILSDEAIVVNDLGISESNIDESDSEGEMSEESSGLEDSRSSFNSNKKEEAKVDNTDVKTKEVKGAESDLNAAASGKYIIVAGCFQSIENAQNFVSELRSLGYQAHLSGKSSSGLNRVAYGAYDNHVEALKSLASIRLNHNAQAWMTKK